MRYPRKGQTRLAKPGQQCQICRAAPAKVVTDYEEDEFRGDDVVLRACESCQRLPAHLAIRKAAESLAALKKATP
jgi:hypothetical protein